MGDGVNIENSDRHRARVYACQAVHYFSAAVATELFLGDFTAHPTNQQAPVMPALYNLSIAIELASKSILINAGKYQIIKEIGHDIEGAIDLACQESGFSERSGLTCEDRKSIRALRKADAFWTANTSKPVAWHRLRYPIVGAMRLPQRKAIFSAIDKVVVASIDTFPRGRRQAGEKSIDLLDTWNEKFEYKLSGQ